MGQKKLIGFLKILSLLVISFLIIACGGDGAVQKQSQITQGELLEKVTGKASSEWRSVGKTYKNSTYIRTYNGEKYIYAAAKEAGAGSYKIFETEIGKTYRVSAELLGADVNSNEEFVANSYITVSNNVPVRDESYVIASSNMVTGSTKVVETFTFVATGITSYVALRSDRAWKYANAKAITLTEVADEENSCNELLGDESWSAFGSIWKNKSYSRTYNGETYIYIAAI